MTSSPQMLRPAEHRRGLIQAFVLAVPRITTKLRILSLRLLWRLRISFGSRPIRKVRTQLDALTLLLLISRLSAIIGMRNYCMDIINNQNDDEYSTSALSE